MIAFAMGNLGLSKGKPGAGLTAAAGQGAMLPGAGKPGSDPARSVTDEPRGTPPRNEAGREEEPCTWDLPTVH